MCLEPSSAEALGRSPGGMEVRGADIGQGLHGLSGLK